MTPDAEERIATLIGWAAWNGPFLIFAVRNTVACAFLIGRPETSTHQSFRNGAHGRMFVNGILLGIVAFVLSSMAGATGNKADVSRAFYWFFLGSGILWTIAAALAPFWVLDYARRYLDRAPGEYSRSNAKWFWLILLSPLPLLAMSVFSGLT